MFLLGIEIQTLSHGFFLEEKGVLESKSETSPVSVPRDLVSFERHYGVTVLKYFWTGTLKGLWKFHSPCQQIPHVEWMFR